MENCSTYCTCFFSKHSVTVPCVDHQKRPLYSFSTALNLKGSTEFQQTSKRWFRFLRLMRYYWPPIPPALQKRWIWITVQERGATRSRSVSDLEIVGDLETWGFHFPVTRSMWDAFLSEVAEDNSVSPTPDLDSTIWNYARTTLYWLMGMIKVCSSLLFSRFFLRIELCRSD